MSEKNVPRLRGHHLICLHFFGGKGYSEPFVENLRNVLSKAAFGEDVVICSGADDICRLCPNLEEGLCRYNNNAEDEIKAMDLKALNLLGLREGMRVKWEAARETACEVFPLWHRAFCAGCDWRAACGENELFRGLEGKGDF